MVEVHGHVVGRQDGVDFRTRCLSDSAEAVVLREVLKIRG